MTRGVVIDIDRHPVDQDLDIVLLRSSFSTRIERIGKLYLEKHGTHRSDVPTSWGRLLEEDAL